MCYQFEFLAVGEVCCSYCIPACFVWGVKLCNYISLPVTMDSGNSFHSSLDGCTCIESGLKMLIFLLFYQISCVLSVPHTQYYVHLWWTTASQWVHLCELKVSKIGTCTCIALASWCAEPTVAVIIIMSHHFVILQHFMTCCIVIMPSPYTSFNWPWILMGDMCSPKTNWITLWTWQDHVPLWVAIAHQHIPWVASVWLTFMSSVGCLNFYFTSATSYQKLKCVMNIKVTE
jgi:hypothetical protein